MISPAVVFLERAKLSNRYDSRDFPYGNMGLIYEVLGLPLKAYEEYCRILLIAPWGRKIGFIPKLENDEEELFTNFIKANKR